MTEFLARLLLCEKCGKMYLASEQECPYCKKKEESEEDLDDDLVPSDVDVFGDEDDDEEVEEDDYDYDDESDDLDDDDDEYLDYGDI